MPDFQWTESVEANLRDLWAQGMPTRAIAAKIGCSKNAVVGKARRLGLKPRGNCIKPYRPGTKRPSRAKGAVKFSPVKQRMVRVDKIEPAVTEPPQPGRPTVSGRRGPAPVAAQNGGSREPCRYPFGDPKAPGFRFCDDPGIPGKPYCEAHMALCYLRVGEMVG